MWAAIRGLALRSSEALLRGRPTGTSSALHSSGAALTAPGDLVTIYDLVKQRMVTRDSNAVPRTVFVWDEEPVGLGIQHGFGYAPLQLGQRIPTLDGKEFEIKRKLGWGQNSSVWLGMLRDEEKRSRRYYAYKALTADASALLARKINMEKDVLLAIQRNKARHGSEFCDKCYVWLPIQTPHGRLGGFVFDVHGSDLHALAGTQPGHRFSSAITRRILKQLLQALNFLHTACGVIHTDVKPSNICVKILRDDQTIEEHLARDPSTEYAPRVEPAISPEPIVTVCSQPLPNFGLASDLGNLSICLGDFGSAVFVRDGLTHKVQPDTIRAPESLLGHPWSTPLDVWSVGCLAFEFLIGAPTFPHVLKGWEDVPYEEGYLQLLIAQHGVEAFTPDFISKCTRREPYFDEKGSLKFQPRLLPISVEERMRNGRYAEADVSDAARFIGRCLTINPIDRPSAAELLRDDWLKSVED